MAGSQPNFAELTSSDLDAIREATRTAELRTGGELVVVLVKRCDVYASSYWKGATLGAFAGAAAVGLWQTFALGWQPLAPYLLPLTTLISAAVGMLAVAGLPLVRRLLVPSDILDLRADRRAALAFLDEEIFDTRDRTGVLLFVAFFEHRVRILVDSGVRERVEQSVWDSIAGELTRGIRAGRTREALLTAIDACATALESHSVERRADDENELSDKPRVLDD